MKFKIKTNLWTGIIFAAFAAFMFFMMETQVRLPGYDSGAPSPRIMPTIFLTIILINSAILIIQSLVFKNVGSLIGIRFATAADAKKTKSITIKAKKSETEYCGLTGSVAVTLDAESKVPVTGEGSADYVKILPPSDGFVEATTYYAVVCPGTFKGVDVIFTDYLRFRQSIDAVSPLTRELKILGEYAEGESII